MARIARYSIIALGLALALLLLLWATSPDPKLNHASFEDAELVAGIAALDEAVTLAQSVREDGTLATLLVVGLEEGGVLAIDLAEGGAAVSSDPFAVLASMPDEALQSLAARNEQARYYAMESLIPAAPTGSRHIGTGTNFPEHAEEASSGSVFQFPKFGEAMGARSSVVGRDDVLLDYEVEFCMRFDRPIASLEDFDAAVKGIFLCGDFTDRSTLIRTIDLDNLDSGRGFSDGKSRADFYPSGALLVIPRDWKSFVAAERMMTFVNGEPRQDARGGEMTLDFRGLTEKALGDMDRARFLYQGDYFTLTPEPVILPETTLMSGTAEGVIFTQPTRGDIIEGGARWLLTAAWARGEGIVPSVIESFIANEFASGHFLQPGDVVEHRSARLGDIRVEVVE